MIGAVLLFVLLFLAMLGCLEVGRRLRATRLRRGSRETSRGPRDRRNRRLRRFSRFFSRSRSRAPPTGSTGAAPRSSRRRTTSGPRGCASTSCPPAAQPKLRDAFRRYTDSRIATYRTFARVGPRGRPRRVRPLRRAPERDLGGRRRRLPRDSAREHRPPAGPQRDVRHHDDAPRRHPVSPAADRLHRPRRHLARAAPSSSATRWARARPGAGRTSSSSPRSSSFTLYVILDFEYPRLGLIRIDDFDKLLVDVREAMK